MDDQQPREIDEAIELTAPDTSSTRTRRARAIAVAVAVTLLAVITGGGGPRDIGRRSRDHRRDSDRDGERYWRRRVDNDCSSSDGFWPFHWCSAVVVGTRFPERHGTGARHPSFGRDRALRRDERPALLVQCRGHAPRTRNPMHQHRVDATTVRRPPNHQSHSARRRTVRSISGSCPPALRTTSPFATTRGHPSRSVAAPTAPLSFCSIPCNHPRRRPTVHRPHGPSNSSIATEQCWPACRHPPRRFPRRCRQRVLRANSLHVCDLRDSTFPTRHPDGR